MISLNKVGVKMIKRFICFLLLIAPCNFVFSETRLPDGSIIECPIINNLFNGQGSQTWANGDSYTGTFKDGLYNGQGKFSCTSFVYEGMFENGLFEGEGTLTDKSGNLYKGNFHQGYKSGKGFETFADGSSYLGEYENDLFSGRGVLKYSDGAYYVGDFKDNNFNGEGVLTLSNGKKIKGRFENGNVIRKKSLADIPVSTIVNIICLLLIFTNFVTLLKYRILKNKMKAISKNSED